MRSPTGASQRPGRPRRGQRPTVEVWKPPASAALLGPVAPAGALPAAAGAWNPAPVAPPEEVQLAAWAREVSRGALV